MAKDVTCHKCDYEWEYSGNMQIATCPSCGLKTPVDGENE